VAEIPNGTSARRLGAARWRKSSYSGAVGNCVEIAWVDGQVTVRNSKNPDGPVLVHPPTGLDALVAKARSMADQDPARHAIRN
jgi:hypothetical protein